MSKTTFTAGFILFALTGVFSSSYAQPSKQEMARLIQKMDMLDSMDFQDAIVAANNCVKKRDFSCADRELKKARQLATNKERKQALALTEATFEGEKELVSIEKQQKELEEKIRQERIAEKKREREWQLEQARRQRLAEERAREQREKQQLISLGVGLLAGAATVYNGGDSELGAQVAEQTATGFYASMSGDREAQLKYQKQTAAMEQNLAQFKARQQAARQQQAERQREHQQMIKRHQENMRISQNRPTVKSVPSPAATRPAQPRLAQNNTASTQSQIRQRAAEEAKQQRAREKQAYEAQRMAEVEAARQRMAAHGSLQTSNSATRNQQRTDTQEAGASPISTYVGASSESDNLLQSIGGNKFKLARYEPAGNGYVWKNVTIEASFSPNTLINTPESNRRAVTASLRLLSATQVAGYKYQGVIYPYQPVQDTQWAWMATQISIAGDIFEGGRKVASFKDAVATSNYGSTPVQQIEASNDHFEARNFEFRNLIVLPDEIQHYNRMIQDHLERSR